MSNATVFLEKNLIKNTFLFLFVFWNPIFFHPNEFVKINLLCFNNDFLLKGNIYGIKKKK
ncbi:Uncharacterised protein [Providencia alcalifaciens]|nr:Uncharacterised protein [Providencia alcalifaciens]